MKKEEKKPTTEERVPGLKVRSRVRAGAWWHYFRPKEAGGGY